MDTKKSKRIPLGTPGYHRLTMEKRIIIWTLKKAGKSQSEMAKVLGCDKGTVSRELSRNVSKKGYRHKKAQGKADHRAAVKAAKRRKLTNKMWECAKEKMWLGWTPEQIAGRAKRDGVPMVCKETLYREYYRRQELVRQGKSKEVLPPLPRRQRKRKARDRNAKKYRNAGRGQIPDRVDIDERPKSVENRARVGHWEET
jgi:IS30 family transposase